MIYVMNGNHTKVPKASRQTRRTRITRRISSCCANGTPAATRSGFSLRRSHSAHRSAGRNWKLLLAGFRNAYDFDFSPQGEMFTFDSDMEWDWGAPGIGPRDHSLCERRRIRLALRLSKWPEYYADSLPPVVNIGIGSPTGVKFGPRATSRRNIVRPCSPWTGLMAGFLPSTSNPRAQVAEPTTRSSSKVNRST